MIKLRPYQADTLSASEAATCRKVRRQLAVLPTGAGKTIVFAELIRRRRGRALVLAHRDELLTQAAAKIRMIDPGAEVGTIQGNKDDHAAQIVVASTATLARTDRLARISSDFSTIVVDEAHHSAATSYLRILDHLGAFGDNGPLVFGVTATPTRGDGIGLDAIYEEIVHEVAIVDLIRAGYLADIRAVRVSLALANFKTLHTRAGEIVSGEAGQMLHDARAPKHVLTAWRINASTRKTLIFVPTVDLAHEMAATFAAAGVTAAAISGDTPPSERRATLAAFQSGELQVIANAALLTEGVDLPEVGCVVIARPTRSAGLYAQMIGRGLRRHPGKPDCLVIDVVGSTDRHDLVTTASLFGLPLDAVDHRTSVRTALDRQRSREQATSADGNVISLPVDLLGGMTWVQVPRSDRFTLTAGDRGSIILAPNQDAWRVLHVQPHQAGAITIAEGVDLSYAQGIAEDHIRTLGMARLTDREAPWRASPPTEKQLRACWALGIPDRATKGKTKGEVADLIAAAKASVELAGVA